MRTLLFLSLLTVVSPGCTSFRTTIMKRCSNDTFIQNTPKKHTTGLPVRLKVPTHVEVVVQEDFFIEEDQGVLREIPVRLEEAEVRALSVQTQTIYTDKVFTVDFRRPAAGMLNLTKIQFDQEQYFASISAEYTERTLEDINAAVDSLRPALSSGVRIAKKHKTVAAEVREVARARFDISTPCWEEQMHEFVSRHVTSRHPDSSDTF